MKTSLWTEEKIKIGFERFCTENGRLPTATEVDQTPYLPSSRWIQIKYGGLEALRSSLGFQHSHFGKGEFRSQIARRVNDRGRLAEIDIEKQLINKFGEVFVHTEKVFGGRKFRLDFYVYSPDGNFGVDIFCPDTINTMQSAVNIKMHKYKGFSEALYLVVKNEIISQSAIDSYAKSKLHLLPANVKLVNLPSFMSVIESKQSYPDPLKT